jgi:hypothetical protein
MNIIQQICSEPTGWAALAGWVLYGVSEAVGASRKLKDNTAVGFALHALQAILPVDVEVKAKPSKRRSSRSRSRSRRDSSGRFLPQDPDQ